MGRIIKIDTFPNVIGGEFANLSEVPQVFIDDGFIFVSTLELTSEGKFYEAYNSDGTADTLKSIDVADTEDTRKQLAVINREFLQSVKDLIGEVPKHEVDSWGQQEQEARAYLLDNTVSTPLIDAIASARGVAKDLLITKIIEKADAYTVAIGTLIGNRQAKEDLL